jgi:hypothetical protein
MYAFPALLTLGVDTLRPSVIERLHRISLNKIVKAGIVVFIALDAFLLLGYSFKPGKETIKVYKWIYKKGIKSPFSILTVAHSPYLLSDFPINYYRPPNLSIVETHTADSLKRVIKASKEPVIVWSMTFELPDSLKDPSVTWKVECRSIPPWLKYFNINHWLSRIRVWTIYSARYSS